MVYGVPVDARHTLAEVLEPLDHASPGYGAWCVGTVCGYSVWVQCAGTVHGVWVQCITVYGYSV
jgi:hypothetical protein